MPEFNDDWIRQNIFANEDLQFVDRIINPESFKDVKIDFGEGSFGTHLMAHEIKDDGKWMVFPTIVLVDQDSKGNWGKNTIKKDVFYPGQEFISTWEGAKQLELREAQRYALETGGYIEFDTEKEASYFSKNYKNFWKEPLVPATPDVLDRSLLDVVNFTGAYDAIGGAVRVQQEAENAVIERMIDEMGEIPKDSITNFGFHPINRAKRKTQVYYGYKDWFDKGEIGLYTSGDELVRVPIDADKKRYVESHELTHYAFDSERSQASVSSHATDINKMTTKQMLGKIEFMLKDWSVYLSLNKEDQKSIKMGGYLLRSAEMDARFAALKRGLAKEMHMPLETKEQAGVLWSDLKNPNYRQKLYEKLKDNNDAKDALDYFDYLSSERLPSKSEEPLKILKKIFIERIPELL